MDCEATPVVVSRGVKQGDAEPEPCTQARNRERSERVKMAEYLGLTNPLAALAVPCSCVPKLSVTTFTPRLAG